jgi:tetratricopeptide (TPR) repeat protein/outer membrane protein assembly factor BamB
MNSPWNLVRLSALALLALVGLSAAPAQQQEESVVLDEVKKDFLDKIQKCEESRDWKGLFLHYTHGLTRYAQKVVPLEKGAEPTRFTSVSEFLTQRLSRLPKEAYEYYRLENDGRARAAFEKAQAERDRRALERLVEEFFFSTVADDCLDLLGNLAFDEGRVEEAIFYWNRLLRSYPDSKIPRAVVAARIAHAAKLAENEAALGDLRRYAAEAKLEGPVTVGGRPMPLAEFLASVQIPARLTAPRPLKIPYDLGPQDRLARRMPGVRNDIKRWSYDFAADRSEAAQAAPAPEPRVRIMGRFNRGEVPQPMYGEFPLFPAYTRVRGRDYVIASDGSRVIAFDPARVRGTSVTSGVYWKFPENPIQRPPPNAGQGNFLSMARPYVGVSAEGEYAYVGMASRLEVRPRDPNPQNFDTFDGVTSVKCLHIPSGKLVWDTDRAPLLDEMKSVCKDFFDRNFSFSGPPLVRGERLYLGICTSPVGEQESRVLCLDRKTGRPLWCTFLASVTGGRANAWAWQSARVMVSLTLLAEQGGVIYVQTNLGCVAALNGVSGSVLWITKYSRTGLRVQTNGVEPFFIRPANWPWVWKDRLFVLSQDRAELLAFDRSSGQPITLPVPKRREGEELDWRNMTHLVGVVNDWMVIGGAQSHVLRLADFQPYNLAASNTSRCGRGVIDGDLVYLPAASSTPGNKMGVLAVYDVRTWKSIDQPPWKDENEFGNLLVAGNYLVVATNRLSVYTDVETLRGEFVQRLYQSPPHAASLLEFGDTMRENDRLEEAAEAYLSFIHAAGGDPAFEPRIRQVKSELHAIFLKRGDEAFDHDLLRSLELYTLARQFAYDDRTIAESTRRLAQTYEKLQRWREAVGMYQELIQKGRGLFHREAEDIRRLSDQARKSIDDIVQKAPEAYLEVERQAAEALKKAQADSVEALRDVMDRFPNSKSARDAWSRMRDLLFKQGKFDKLRSLYNELKDRFKLDLNFESTRELLELLEKIGDPERLRFELVRFGERFGAESISTEAGEENVKDYAERRVRELSQRLSASGSKLKGPLLRTGEIEVLRPSAGADVQGVGSGLLPLCPQGVVPPALGRELELFARGSSVELWDLAQKRRLWTRVHPGAYLGVVFSDGPSPDQGVSVVGIKPGSPAERAGIQRGDLILSIGGQIVTGGTFTQILGGLHPGQTVDVATRRGTQDGTTSLELAEHPWDLRPALVGAAFTRDYSLAVAWEDQVVSIELATGRLQWSFSEIRDRFLIRALQATDGRLHLYESHRADRDHDVFRTHSPQGNQERQSFRPEDAYHRLLCLSDFSGNLVWARALEFDAGNPSQPCELAFFGKYLSDSVTFLQGTPKAGGKEWVLWSIPAQDGQEAVRRVLQGTVLAYTVEVEGRTFYYVSDSVGERKERYLYSLALDPARKDPRPIEIALHQKYMPPTYAVCSLSANRQSVCLVVAPQQPGTDGLLWVFHAADGKESRALPLLAGRTLVAGRSAAAGLEPGGLLYVYNVPREKPSGGGALPNRAFLTAYRVDAASPEDVIAWDAVAPVLSAGGGAGWTILPDTGEYTVLAAGRAALPGLPGESSVAVVYDTPAEGYLRLAYSDLAVPVEAPFGVSAWRGRLYLSARQGLQIYGD